MYWYRVDIDHIDKMHNVAGCSELACLKHLIYRDSQRRVQSWSEWDTFVKDKIWINPKRVTAFQELSQVPETE
jgi:hypothetical protein